MKRIITKNAQTYEDKKRFRGSIYVDIFVPDTNNLEEDRYEAEKILEEISNKLPLNSFVGGVAYFKDELSLDREI